MQLPYFINVVLYCYSYFLYVWLWVYTGVELADERRDSAALEIGIAASLVALHVLNFILFLNLVFASLKRLGKFICGSTRIVDNNITISFRFFFASGPHVGLRKPFDCATYASSINKILTECNANVRVDDHMQIVAR